MRKFLKAGKIIYFTLFLTMVFGGCDFVTLPDAPENVIITATSYNSISISWDLMFSADKYNIYRSTNGEDSFNKIGSSVFDSYTDKGLTEDTVYHYKVSSVNKAESPLSNMVSARTRLRPLSAPTNIKVITISKTAITINWTAVPDVEGYYIYRSTNYLSNYYQEIGSSLTVSYTDNDLTPNTQYFYKISSYVNNYESPQSTYIEAKTNPEIPRTPVNINAAARSIESIRINWGSVSNAESYIVYRSLTDADDYEEISTVSSASYTDNELSPETTYYYKVSACNISGESALSDMANATTLSGKPNAPTAVSASAVFYYITISWSSVSNSTGYIVYRSTSASGDYEIIAYPSETSYKDTGLDPDTTYHYRVSAVNLFGESAQSTSRSATTYSANAGTSPLTAINIPFGSIGITGDFTNGMDEIWYKLTRNGAGALYAIDSNYNTSSEDYGDIVVTVCDSEYYSITITDGTAGKIRLLENIDIGKGSGDPNNIIASNWNGTFYVLVKPKTNTMLDKRPFRLFFVLFF